MLQNDEKHKNIDKVYAVSGIIKRPIDRIFKDLGFDVKVMKIEDAKTDKELSKFYGRFKDKKHLGRAVISREKLFSAQLNELMSKKIANYR